MDVTRFGAPLESTWNEFVNVAELPPASETRTAYIPGGNAPAASLTVICVNESTEIEVAG